MTPAELNADLDDMQAAASSDAEKPGLITIKTDDWISNLDAIKATCARLDDGLRHRNIQIHIGSQQQTKVITRAEAGAKGEPYRELTPRA